MPVATTTLTYSPDELAGVIALRAKQTSDALHKKLVLFVAMAAAYGGKGQPSKDGGQKWQYDVEIAEHSTATGLPTGYEEIGLDAAQIWRSMFFSPGFVTAPYLISDTESNVFGGQAAQLDLQATRADNVFKMLHRKMQLHFFSGGQAAFVTGGWATANGTDYSGGYVEEDTYGTQGNTVGGLSKSTYAAIAGMNNRVYNLGSAVGSNGRAQILAALNAIEERQLVDEMIAWFATQACMTNLERVMFPYMRYTQKESADLAGQTILIKGKPIYACSDLPIAGTNTTTYKWSLLGLDLKHIHPVWLKGQKTDGFFGMVPPVQHSGSRRVQVGYVDCNGQVVVEGKFDSSVLLYNGETY